MGRERDLPHSFSQPGDPLSPSTHLLSSSGSAQVFWSSKQGTLGFASHTLRGARALEKSFGVASDLGGFSRRSEWPKE